MVTQDGIENGETTLSVLTRVLGLTGLAIEGDRVQLPTPPVRDPFRAPRGQLGRAARLRPTTTFQVRICQPVTSPLAT